MDNRKPHTESPFGPFAIPFNPATAVKRNALSRLDYPVSRGFLLSITDDEAEGIAFQNYERIRIHGSAAAQRRLYQIQHRDVGFTGNAIRKPSIYLHASYIGDSAKALPPEAINVRGLVKHIRY